MSESSETTLVLVWKKPMAKIDIYRLVFVSADGRRTEVEVPGGANTHTLVNLTPGMMYTITLVAERIRRKSAPATITASTGRLSQARKCLPFKVSGLACVCFPPQHVIAEYASGLFDSDHADYILESEHRSGTLDKDHILFLTQFKTARLARLKNALFF